MSGLYLTWLADEFRAAGLEVKEWPGWQTRARRGGAGGYADPKGPLCVVWHHTASNARPESDVRYMADNAPAKPIANVMPDRHGVVWLMAAGATNTNGAGRACEFSRGVCPADQMNGHAFGMEIANDGVGGIYPTAQIDAAFIISNTVNRVVGNLPTDVMTHAIYAPVRKPDPARADAVRNDRFHPHGYGRPNTWVLDDLIAECAARAAWQPPQPKPEPPKPQPRPPAGDDIDMASTQTLLHDVRDSNPGDGGPWYKVGPTSMVWVQDGNALAQMQMRVDECADGTKVSPYDGLVWRQFDHGGDDVMACYGPIDGDVPPNRDRYGRAQ